MRLIMIPPRGLGGSRVTLTMRYPIASQLHPELRPAACSAPPPISVNLGGIQPAYRHIDGAECCRPGVPEFQG